jgi:titin
MSFVLNTWAPGEQYRIVAENTVGDTFNYANPNINEIVAPVTGFPHVTATSSSEVVIVGGIPAPAAPTDLTATLDETVVPPQVNLAWTDNAADETSYDVYRSENGGAFAVIDTLPLDSMSYADTTVASGNHYEYQVAAVNAGGPSYSNIVAVDWTGTVPDAPTNLAAAVVSATQVDLTWTDNAINETGYVVERSDNGGAFAAIANLPADAVAYSDLTVAAPNSYNYQVAATNSVGPSGYSNQASVSITLPDAPINLSATNVSRTGFTFNWEYPFPQPDGFEVQISTNSNFNSIEQSFPDVGADLTSLDISGLKRNTWFYVRIRGISAVGVGLWSETLQVRTSK